jgi:hypothetical protein
MLRAQCEERKYERKIMKENRIEGQEKAYKKRMLKVIEQRREDGLEDDTYSCSCGLELSRTFEKLHLKSGYHKRHY